MKIVFDFITSVRCWVKVGHVQDCKEILSTLNSFIVVEWTKNVCNYFQCIIGLSKCVDVDGSQGSNRQQEKNPVGMD